MEAMPAYEIYFRCDDCKREHTIHMKIHLTEGPDRKQKSCRILRRPFDAATGSSLQGHNAFCLKTGRRFKLDKDEQILLVPPSAISLPPRQPQLIPDRN